MAAPPTYVPTRGAQTQRCDSGANGFEWQDRMREQYQQHLHCWLRQRGAQCLSTSRIKVRLWVAASWIRKLNAGGLYVDWSGLIPWKNSETMESRRLDRSEINESILVSRQYYISSMILHRAQRTSFQSSRKIIPNPSFFFLAGSLLAITYLRSQNSKFKFLDEFGKSRTRRWHACGSTPSPTIHAALPPIHPSYPPVVK